MAHDLCINSCANTFIKLNIWSSTLVLFPEIMVFPTSLHYAGCMSSALWGYTDSWIQNVSFEMKKDSVLWQDDTKHNESQIKHNESQLSP